MFKSPTFDEEVFKRHPHFGQFVKYLASLDEESARGATIIAIAVLDELLKDMIAGFLIEGEGSSELLEGRYAPLSTFAARCDAAVALGLISDANTRNWGRFEKYETSLPTSLT